MLRSLTSQIGASLHSVQRFLDRPIGFGRSGLRDAAPSGPAGQRKKPSENERKRVRLINRDLYELLGRHPDSRKLMRHLHRVERALREGGILALEALPPRVLALALDQLERLVWDWSPVGLAELRSRIAVLLKARPLDFSLELSQPSSRLMPFTTRSAVASGDERGPSGFEPQMSVDVTEVGHEMFAEMERSWIGRVPDPATAPGTANDTPPAGN